jgi:hypothetical protein
MRMNCNANEVVPEKLRDILCSLYEDVIIKDIEMIQTMYDYDPWKHENEYTTGTCILIVEEYGLWFNRRVTAYLEYYGMLVLLKKR